MTASINSLRKKKWSLQAAVYVLSYKGNYFYTFKNQDGLVMVKGRNTYLGPTQYFLVPPKTKLYDSISRSFHRKFHFVCASPTYIRQQLLSAGYYLPSALKRLKKLKEACPLCRRRTKKALHQEMGAVKQLRMSLTAPFVSMQADLIGPYIIKSFVNQWTTRKIWILSFAIHYY